jgi:hypothetical protein
VLTPPPHELTKLHEVEVGRNRRELRIAEDLMWMMVNLKDDAGNAE